MHLNKEHVDKVCIPGNGAFTCSYLVFSSEVRGFECAKGTELEVVILKRRAQKSMNAMGDNCSGPPDFKVAQETIH